MSDNIILPITPHQRIFFARRESLKELEELMQPINDKPIVFSTDKPEHDTGPLFDINPSKGIVNGMLTYADNPRPSFTGTIEMPNVTVSDFMREWFDENPKFDIVIKQRLGHLPRKMKKAYKQMQTGRWKRETKWMRKMHHYLLHRAYTITDAELVVTKDQQDRLAEMIFERRSGKE